MRCLLVALLALACTACATSVAPSFDRAAALDAGVPAILSSRHIAGAGVAVIRAGHVVWTGYYGEQGPGVAASRDTMFNSASLAKSITAQAVLRLATERRLSLDEPIAAYYVEPDLAGDPRYRKLTPRLILSHRSGLLNWSYVYPDKKLAFVAEPGARFGYSGAAYDILAHFLERKFGTTFDALVAQEIFEPLGMTHVSMRRRASIDPYVTTPMNAAGRYEAPYTTHEHDWHHGSWSAASDLYVSVDDYAKFMLALMRHDGVSDELAQQQLVPVASFVGASEWACEPAPGVVCPERYGFGLGWMVFDYGTWRLVWGGGNDSGENAVVYFSPDQPGDATIVFVNGGNGVVASLDIIELIDPTLPLVPYIRQLIDRHTQAAAQP